MSEQTLKSLRGLIYPLLAVINGSAALAGCSTPRLRPPDQGGSLARLLQRATILQSLKD